MNATKKEFIVASPYCGIETIKSMLKDIHAKQWVYFGSDFSAISSLERKLTSGYTRIDYIQIHKDVADSIKAEYVTWIDELNKKYGHEINWWLGSVFSRNNYTSNLFQYACYLEILDRLLSERGVLPNIVFVNSRMLAEDIKKWARKKNISVLIKYKVFDIAFSARLVKPLLDWFRFIIISISRIFAAFISRFNYKRKKALPIGSVIIHTFIHDSSLSKSGVLTERYLPFLYDYASCKGMKVVIHPVLYDFRYSYRSIYTRMRISNVPFIIREDFLRISDYLSALVYPFKSLCREIEIKDFRSFSLSHSIKEMRRQECFSQAMEAMLAYRLFYRLKKTGFEPAHFLLWFENQVMDKAIIYGARQSFPRIKIVGAQMFLHPPNLLSLFPAQSEIDACVSPDILIETSEYQCKRATIFTNTILARVGAGLRYAHVFKKEKKLQSTEFDVPTILVVLPFDLSESMEILALLKESLGYIKHKVSILVKVHPNFSVKLIKKKFGESIWPKAFGIITGNLALALEKASVMISANSSSMVEAVSYGVPVIYAGSRILINQNILKDLDLGITQECYTPLALADAINKYIETCQDKVAEYEEIGNRIRNQYFTPVSDKTLAPFFDIGQVKNVE